MCRKRNGGKVKMIRKLSFLFFILVFGLVILFTLWSILVKNLKNHEITIVEKRKIGDVNVYVVKENVCHSFYSYRNLPKGVEKIKNIIAPKDKLKECLEIEMCNLKHNDYSNSFYSFLVDLACNLRILK